MGDHDLVRPATRRTLRGTVAALVAAAALFPLLHVALVPERRPPIAALPMPPAGAYQVLVVDRGYHTAIVVPQPPGWRLGPPGEETAPLLEYAWGDRRFYMESDYRPHAVLATLFLPTESVLYLDGLTDPRRLNAADAMFVRTVDAPTLHALLTELERSIRRSGDGARQPAFPPVAGYAGRFLPAHDSYLWARGVVFTPQVPGRLRGFTRLPRAGAP